MVFPSKKHIGWVFFAMTMFFLIFLHQSYQERGWLYSFLDNQRLIPREETFTELYFSDSANLPSQINGGETVTFPFVIHNLEASSTTYAYEVLLIEKGAVTTLPVSTGATTIEKGEYRTIYVQMSFSQTPKNSLVVVRLSESGKEIRFSVNKSN